MLSARRVLVLVFLVASMGVAAAQTPADHLRQTVESTQRLVADIAAAFGPLIAVAEQWRGDPVVVRPADPATGAPMMPAAAVEFENVFVAEGVTESGGRALPALEWRVNALDHQRRQVQAQRLRLDDLLTRLAPEGEFAHDLTTLAPERAREQYPAELVLPLEVADQVLLEYALALQGIMHVLELRADLQARAAAASATTLPPTPLLEAVLEAYQDRQPATGEAARRLAQEVAEPYNVARRAEWNVLVEELRAAVRVLRPLAAQHQQICQRWVDATPHQWFGAVEPVIDDWDPSASDVRWIFDPLSRYGLGEPWNDWIVPWPEDRTNRYPCFAPVAIDSDELTVTVGVMEDQHVTGIPGTFQSVVGIDFHVPMQLVLPPRPGSGPATPGEDSYPAYPRRDLYALREVVDVYTIGHGCKSLESPWTVDPGAPTWDLLPREVAQELGPEHVLVLVRGRHLFLPGKQPSLWTGDLGREYRVLWSFEVDEAVLAQTSTSVPCKNLWERYCLRRSTDAFLADSRSSAGNGRGTGFLKAGEQVIVAVTAMKQGTPTGFQSFEVDPDAGTARREGAAGHWFFDGNATADVRLMRVRDGANINDELEHVLVHDRVLVEIEASQSLSDDLDEIDFQIALNGQPAPGPDKVFTAYRVQGKPRVYRSRPFHIAHRNGNSWGRRGDTSLTCRHGDTLVVALSPRSGVTPLRLPKATVITSTDEVSAMWRYAVWRAAKASGRFPELGEVFDADRLASWDHTTVESKSFFLVFGDDERRVEVKYGDVAGMILLRDRFIQLQTKAIAEYQALVDRVNSAAVGASASNATELRTYRLAVRDALRRDPRMPLGRMPVRVRHPSGRADVEVTLSQICLYDQAWRFGVLSEHPNPDQWLDSALLAAVNQQLTYMRKALAHAKGVGDDDAEDLLALTGVGFQPVADRLITDMVDLAEVQTGRGPGFVWNVNHLARAHVRRVDALGVVYYANERVASAIDDVGMAIGALFIAAPASLAWRSVALAVSTSGAAEAVFNGLPNHIRSQREVVFAFGANRVIGNERITQAMLAAKPESLVAVTTLASFLGMGVDIAQFLRALNAARASGDAVEQALRLAQEQGPARMLEVTAPDVQVAVVARVLEAARAGGRVEQEAATLATALPRALRTHAETRTFEVLQGFEDAQALTISDVRMFAISEDVRAIHPHWRLETRTATRAGRGGSTGSGGTVPPPVDPDMATPAGSAPILRLEESQLVRQEPPALALANTRIQDMEVGEELGRGVFARVHELRNPEEVAAAVDAGDIERLCAKFYVRRAQEAIQRQRHAHTLAADAGIPQLRIVRYESGGRFPHVLQEQAPSGSKILGAYILDDGTARLIGIPEDVLPSEYGKALCRLYKKIADEGLYWWDGHLGNIVFIEKGTSVEAKMLDQDYLWKAGESFYEGPMESSAKHLDGCYAFPRKYHIQSMTGQKLPPNYSDLLDDGRHLWDPELFMMKMLERWRMIRYDSEVGFVDGYLRVKDAKDIFQRLDSPEVINPVIPSDPGRLPPSAPRPVPANRDRDGVLLWLPDESLRRAA